MRRELAKRLMGECKRMKIGEIGLEVLHGNKTCCLFLEVDRLQTSRPLSVPTETRANCVQESDALISQTGQQELLDGVSVCDRGE